MPTDSGTGNTAGVEYVITLVHGTWARRAPWIGPDSSLSQALRTRFGDRSAIFPFDWSGGNSHAARRQAAESLRRTLVERLEAYPGARHYLICHSHGGNVALRALADSDLADRVAGVACLATPFLVARPRDLGPDPLRHLAGALVVVMFMTLWLADRLLPVSWPGLARFVTVVLASVLVVSAGALLMRNWHASAERLRRELATPDLGADKLLIVRSPADEASGALALFQFVSQLSVRLYVRVFALYEWFEAAAQRWTRHKGRLLGVAAGAASVFVGLVLLAASLSWTGGFQSGLHVATVAAAFASLLVATGAFYLLLGWVSGTTLFIRLMASAVVWPVVGLLSVLLLPFGWEVAMANILLEVTAETTPPGAWTVHLMEPPTAAELGRDVAPLMHSVVYENPRVLALLCDWIAGGAARSGADG